MARITGILHEDQYTFLIIFRSVLRMRNVPYKNRRENQNTHFVFNVYFLNKIVSFVSRMAHTHCILDTSRYRHALRICNTYCFTMAKMVLGSSW